MNTQPNPKAHKEIQVGAVLSEAWQLVSGLKLPIFLLSLLMLVIGVGVSSLIGVVEFGVFLSFIDSGTGGPLLVLIMVLLQLIQICIAFGLWLLVAIAIVLGIKQSIGKSIELHTAFAECMRVKWKIFGLFLIMLGIAFVIMCLSSLLHIMGLPRFILSLLTSFVLIYFFASMFIFALPLVIIKHSDISFALKSAVSMMNQHLVPVYVCYLIMLVLNFIGSIPFGIGLIWTLPMTYAMIGILFRDISGLQNSHRSPAETHNI